VEEFYNVAQKLAFVLLAAWVILAGLGMTSMPGSTAPAPRRRRAGGQVWAVPVVQAQSSEDSLSFPQAALY
jgi:hypothetical protein